VGEENGEGNVEEERPVSSLKYTGV